VGESVRPRERRRENVHIPRRQRARERLAEHCVAYERAIAEAGGIDFQLLGIGKSGHIASTSPDPRPTRAPPSSHSDTVTRKDAERDFFREDNVPREAITNGVGDDSRGAGKSRLVATGEHKARIVQRSARAILRPTWGGDVCSGTPTPTVYLDLAAAGELTRVKTPWVLEAVEWTGR